MYGEEESAHPSPGHPVLWGRKKTASRSTRFHPKTSKIPIKLPNNMHSADRKTSLFSWQKWKYIWDETLQLFSFAEELPRGQSLLSDVQYQEGQLRQACSCKPPHRRSAAKLSQGDAGPLSSPVLGTASSNACCAVMPFRAKAIGT